MDSVIQEVNPQNCAIHNQPIVSYDKQNQQAQCVTCLVQINSQIPVEQIQQQIQQISEYGLKELNGQQQINQTLLDSLITRKYSFKDSIDKIIQIVKDNLKSIDSQIQQYKLIQKSNTNSLQRKKELENELANIQENHVKFRSVITQQLDDIQKKFINIDYLLNLMNDNQNLQKNAASSNQQKEKKFEYQLIEDQSLKLDNECYALAINNKNNILLIGCENEIIIYELNEGRIVKQQQRLNENTKYISCLYFMKESDSFVSGSYANQIVVWILDANNQWAVKQILNDQDPVNCILMNKIEDLLISGNDGRQIKFWEKQNDQWSCKQSIDLEHEILAMSLNQTEDKLISCGKSSKIYIMEIQNKQWNIKQEIETSAQGLRLCFTLENQFVFQSVKGNYLEIYDYDDGKQQFIKLQQVQIQQSDDCLWYFSCFYLKEFNILFIKNGNLLNIFKVNQNNDYQLIQTIQFKYNWSFGRTTDDGQYLIIWDYGQKQIEFRRLTIQDD